MTGRFEGRTVIVTGASRGIGLGIAQRVVDEGGKAVITARKEEELVAAVKELGEGNAVYSVGKADDAAHQEATVKLAVDTFGSADFLVNNAAVNPHFGDLTTIGLDAARKMLDVNVTAPLFWAQAAYQGWMKEHGGGVVNIASVAGLRPPPMIGWYGVSKRALIGLTEQLAMELGPGIRVNAVAPAVVKTKFASALYEGKEEEVSAVYPLKRLGVPADIASVVTFLLSDDSSWMTGQTLTVDGGVMLAGQL